MRLIWHIINKDMLRCRWLLLALAGVWLVKAGLLYVLCTGAADSELRNYYWPHIPIAINGASMAEYVSIRYTHRNAFFDMISIIGCFTDIALLLGITLRALREDSAFDERSLWRTRPVSRKQMLAAKTMFLGLATFPLLFVIQAGVVFLIIKHNDMHAYYQNSANYNISINNLNLNIPVYTIWADSLKSAMLVQACWTAAAVLVATLWRNRLIGMGVLILSALCTVFFAESMAFYRRMEDAVFDDTLIFALLYVLLTGSALIGAVMYLKSNRAAGFSLFAAMLITIFTLTFVL